MKIPRVAIDNKDSIDVPETYKKIEDIHECADEFAKKFGGVLCGMSTCIERNPEGYLGEMYQHEGSGVVTIEMTIKVATK